MDRPQSPIVDAFGLARTAAVCEGEVEIARLPRLAESLLSAEGRLRYRIEGRLGDDGHPGAVVHLAATLMLTCQRCNQPLAFDLDRTTDFRFVQDEAEFNALPIDDDETEAVIGSRAMPVLPWIEDEAILSLPLVPRHTDCGLPLTHPAPTMGRRASPFAQLGDLLESGAKASGSNSEREPDAEPGEGGELPPKAD
jgi:uncharacterized protein